MMHTARLALVSPIPLASMPVADELEFRQLRHQTKNALQRIIAQIDRAGLRGTPAGDRLADDIERRICLTARVSDALFGLSERPPAMRQRLVGLCEAMVALLGDGTQSITVAVEVRGACPVPLQQTVLQVAHEMLGNAIKHGLHVRLVGKLEVVLDTTTRRTTLSVADDGWGLLPGGPGGQGVGLMQALAARHGGRVALARVEGRTVAMLELP